MTSAPILQRILYLHAATPSIHSKVIGMALHEPDVAEAPQVGDVVEWPYDTVHAAVRDGWRVVHFPQQRVPFDDREIDVLGFEFILEKLEPYLAADGTESNGTSRRDGSER